jgi:Lon protease-like protein
VGQIEQAVPLEDGRYNILVRGEVRFRVVGEVSREPYRTARVIIQPEQSHDVTQTYAQKSWLADLSRQYLHYLPDQIAVPEIETVELEALTNALIMSLNIDVQEKQRLLEIDDLIGRAEQIGNEIQTRIESLQFLAPYRRKGDPGQN